MIDTISAPQPHSRGFSSTVNSGASCDRAEIVWVSSGTSERTSITSQSMPCSAFEPFRRRQRARHHQGEREMVASLPGRRIFAVPSVSTISPSGTSPLVA
jgi:hypothetical protein